MEKIFNRDFISYLISPPFPEFFSVLKIIFLVLTVLFFAAIIFFLFRSNYLNLLIFRDAFEFLNYRPYGIRKVEKTWNKIKARLDTGLESEYKLSIMEADSMLDDTLKRMGYGGETLGERLKGLTEATLTNIEEIKQAHQIRNNIVHDPDYRLSSDEARKTLAIYEKAFQDLQAF